jgi:hypothetical protein
VKNLLGDGFPKFVIRTDIQSFYESIPHDKLQKKISEESLLSFFSKKIIGQILKEYQDKSASSTGLPRGIGISAYLAELYLRDLDNDLKSIPDVTYYARYVDDIIIVFTPTSIAHPQEYLSNIKNIVEGEKYLLSLNGIKTTECDLRDKSQKKLYTLDYLGYRFKFGRDPLTGKSEIELRLTDKKISKYTSRLSACFAHYVNFKKVDEKRARKLLILRVKFLTSNTRLKNNKKNILTGIYYSNSLITSKEDLEHLDIFFAAQINTTSLPTALAGRLRKYSFQQGFSQKKFIPFNTIDLHNAMEVWKKINV